MRFFPVVCWILVYVGLVLGPLIVLLVGPVPPGGGFWVDVARAMGYAAVGMMGVQFFLTARFRRASAPFGIDIIYYFHRIMASFGLALVFAHAVILLRAKPALLARWLAGDIEPHGIAALVSLFLFCVLIVTSVWRKVLNLGYEAWRRWHGVLAAIAVMLAGLHIALAGYYVHAPWKKSFWVAISLSWILLLVYVRLIKPMLLLRRPYRVVDVSPEHGNTWTLRVRPEGHSGIRFQPGQFAWVTVGASPFSLSEHPFSMASSAESTDEIAFTIKALGDFSRSIAQVPLGTLAYLDGPFGAFTTDRFPDAPGFVFIAGGVGIVPLMGMLRTLADRHDTRPIRLIYGNWAWENVIFREELELLKSRLTLMVVHVLQEIPTDWHGESGLLTEELLRRQLPGCNAFVHFVCGPLPMIPFVEQGLHRMGVPLRRIHSELFDLV